MNTFFKSMYVRMSVCTYVCLSVCLSVHRCQWEDKAIRRLIGDGKLAARLVGKKEEDLECPICFYKYLQINHTSCCHAHLCTECYLQIRPQNQKHSTCPFCNHTKLSVKVAIPLTAIPTDYNQEQHSQQQLHQRQSEHTNDQNILPNNSAITTTTTIINPSSTPSNDHHNNTTGDTQNYGDQVMIMVSPEERLALEEQMRAQHYHLLSLSMRREEKNKDVNSDWMILSYLKMLYY